MFKVNKNKKRHQKNVRRRSGVSIVNFLVFLLLTLNKYMPIEKAPKGVYK